MPGWWTPARQAQAYNYLVSVGGLSPYGAAGLVSRWANIESTAQGPTAINLYSGAFGIAQWLGSRLAPIRGNTDFTAQLAYVVRELNGSESRAGSVLRSAQSATDGARGASMYERAEGYNAATGIDNWTTQTSAGINSVLAVVQGSNTMPATVAQTPTNGAPEPFNIGSDYTGETPLISTTTIVLAAAGIGLYLILRD